MRCSTERGVPTGERDSFNQIVTEPTVILTNHPCYWQVRSETFVADGEKLVAVGLHRMMLPKGTDITEQDIVTAVLDRQSRYIKENRLRVTSVIQREDHMAAVLEEYA